MRRQCSAVVDGGTCVDLALAARGTSEAVERDSDDVVISYGD